MLSGLCGRRGAVPLGPWRLMASGNKGNEMWRGTWWRWFLAWGAAMTAVYGLYSAHLAHHKLPANGVKAPREATGDAGDNARLP